MIWVIILMIIVYYYLGWSIAYNIGKSNGKNIQRENDFTIYLSTGKMQDQDGQLVEYKKPNSYNQGTCKFKKEIIQRMSVLHSDIAFVGTDGKIHLVEENIKPDYNEWNW